MKFIKSYIKIIDSFQEKVGSFTSWFTLILVLLTCYDVFTRYLLNVSSVANQELEWHIFSIIFLLSVGYTLKKDEHVRIDLFYDKFSSKTKAWINLIGTVLFLFTFCIIIIWSSINFVEISFRMREGSPDAGGLPARYILKALIPISFFILLLEGISLLFKSYLQIRETSYSVKENKEELK